MTQSTASIDDAITREIVKSALAVAAEEASIVVVRSAYSAFIQEGADACAAILDARAQLVAQSDATSLMHGASLRACLPALLEDIEPGDMSPGDVFVMNDPYRGGIHANDLVVFRPIFGAGEPVYFAGTLIHVADLGGAYPAGLAALATDTFSEGMTVPPVRLYAKGVPEDAIMRLLAANSRTPEMVLGDVRALVAGVNVMAARVGELIEQHGVATLQRFVDASLDYTEARMRDEIRRLPAGTYHGSFRIDSDGLDLERSYDVRVAVTVSDGSVCVDLAGTSGQARGAINASLSQALSGVVYAVRCFVDPTIPMNEGCFRAIEAKFPLGSLVNPRPPAACGGRIVAVCGTTEAIIEALSHAAPERAVAQSAIIHVYALSGAENGVPWLSMSYDFGGLGARAVSDGPDATGCFFLGGRSVIPQHEPMEARFPLRVLRSRLLPDSGGAGRFRGGRGTETAVLLLGDAELTVRGDRIALPPAGRDGGQPGRPGGYAVERADGRLELLADKQSKIALRAGDVFVMRTSGGGGLGEPWERDPDRVLADVCAGSVSRDAAEIVYGVVLGAGGDVVDSDATARRRAAGRRGRG
ncbi:MAG: hydantoinase B/oxoprolinase family protein [Deltaproteobacteria bacterium]|nr:hydantoinase B/oxoprolinase family protein [Deltaproteobacteria bacterium]MBW2361751.1 hydantoinase B/oxoprolinase family protein [Deltaproteobacteria bacterium]